jgi:predicted dinucleotide-binding enzyme
MKISILGTGDVGQTLAEKLTNMGHEVMMGTRDVDNTLSGKPSKNENPSFKEWHSSNKNIKLGTFQESAAFGELVINATNGANSLNALDLATIEITVLHYFNRLIR